ncbi:putative pterin-binding protein [Mesorhizobium sp. A623]
MPGVLVCVLAIILIFALPLNCAAQRLSSDPNELRVEDASGRMVALFTVEQLKSVFEQQTYDTRTPWTGEHETIAFRGPLLETVLEQAGVADADVIKVVAYDDFISEIHRDEILSYKPILAVQRKCGDADRATSRCLPGQAFRPIDLLEKGPIFIVWPFDKLPTSYVPARNSIWVFFPTILRANQ